jgi:hypothetical protein
MAPSRANMKRKVKKYKRCSRKKESRRCQNKTKRNNSPYNILDTHKPTPTIPQILTSTLNSLNNQIRSLPTRPSALHHLIRDLRIRTREMAARSSPDPRWINREHFKRGERFLFRAHENLRWYRAYAALPQSTTTADDGSCGGDRSAQRR